MHASKMRTGAFEASARAELNLIWFHFTCLLSACMGHLAASGSQSQWPFGATAVRIWSHSLNDALDESATKCPNCWPIDGWQLANGFCVDAIPPNEINSSNAFMCHLTTITCNAINVLCAPRKSIRGFCDNFSDRCWTACNVLRRGRWNGEQSIWRADGKRMTCRRTMDADFRFFFVVLKEKCFALSSSLLFHVNALDWSNFEHLFFFFSNISSGVLLHLKSL